MVCAVVRRFPWRAPVVLGEGRSLWPLRGHLLPRQGPVDTPKGLEPRHSQGRGSRRWAARQSGDLLCPCTDLKDDSLFILTATSSIASIELNPKLPTEIPRIRYQLYTLCQVQKAREGRGKDRRGPSCLTHSPFLSRLPLAALHPI